jgi:hypothetical protein
MKKEECRSETKRTKSVAALSSFIILPSAFEMSLITGLRTERYDPAGLGCYERRRFLTGC